MHREVALGFQRRRPSLAQPGEIVVARQTQILAGLLEQLLAGANDQAVVDAGELLRFLTELEKDILVAWVAADTALACERQ